MIYVCKQASTCFGASKKGSANIFFELFMSSIVSTVCLPVQGTLKAGTL